MNDPNKVINVNLSSLLSLKAELLRKQAEVNKAKITRTAEDFIATKRTTLGSDEKRDKKHRIKEVSKQADATVYEHEDSALLEKSQKVLEAKSKYYERMSRVGGKLNSDDNCLVLFNRKRQEDRSTGVEIKHVNSKNYESSSDSSISDDEDDGANEDPDEDWVEYTDCLGRTRKCLRKDLQEAKRRDNELAASMPERIDQNKANWMIDTKGTHSKADSETNDDDATIGPLPPPSIYSDGCSMVSKIDEQRANWERKELENMDKSEVHYQDVFFDEARQHGVGYYAFSTDEEERKRQQVELEGMRRETIEEQKHRDELRAQREKIIAERVRAAKNRQRARLGLPPLEDEPAEKQTEEITKASETKAERKERKRAEKLKRKQDQDEKERELERQQHIRPWDEEKPGVASTAKSNTTAEISEEPLEWVYKPEREPMSQEEWNEHKRAERNPEFAPMPAVEIKRTNFSSMPPPQARPLSMQKNLYNTPPPTFSADDTFNNFQSTKRQKQFHRRNYDNVDNHDANVEDASRRGAAIPPPTDLDSDYTLPPNSKKSKTSSELERSIEAGLKFLRNNADKGTMSTKSSWSAKADY